MLLRTGVPSHVCWVVLTKRSWPQRDRGTDLQIPRCRILERHIDVMQEETRVLAGL